MQTLTLCCAQAYAAARMAESVLRGMAGEGDIYECAYVQSQVTEVSSFGGFSCGDVLWCRGLVLGHPPC